MNAFEVIVDAELLHADTDGRCIAAGNNRRLHTAGLKHFQTVSVQSVERFDFFAVVADKNTAVSQNAVHIQYQQFDT